MKTYSYFYYGGDEDKTTLIYEGTQTYSLNAIYFSYGEDVNKTTSIGYDTINTN